MLWVVSFERRWRRRERIRYWVLERSDWRIESLRFRRGLEFEVVLALEVALLVGEVRSSPEDARSSISSTWI
jgi:hypothetical protein